MEELMQSIIAHNGKLTDSLKHFQETGKITDEIYTASVELAHYLSFLIAGIEKGEIAVKEE